MSSEHETSFGNGPTEIHRGLGIYDGPSGELWELNLDRAAILVRSQRFVSAIDSWSVCEFCFHTWTIFTPDDLIEIIRACTGWRYTLAELLFLGERRINLMRAFNAREGFTKADDTLPTRLFEDGLLDDGPTHGVAVDRDAFIRVRDEYYRLMGWDPATGNPTETKLRELGLDWVLA